MAGTDDHKIWQLPDTTGLKHEVIMMGGRRRVRQRHPPDRGKAGACLFVWKELSKAIGDNTAMIYTMDLGEKLQNEFEKSPRTTKIPMLLDDAAGIPPVDNAKLYAKDGNRHVLLLGRQGAARAAVQRFAAGPEGFD